jgi:hypothetical protein
MLVDKLNKNLGQISSLRSIKRVLDNLCIHLENEYKGNKNIFADEVYFIPFVGVRNSDLGDRGYGSINVLFLYSNPIKIASAISDLVNVETSKIVKEYCSNDYLKNIKVRKVDDNEYLRGEWILDSEEDKNNKETTQIGIDIIKNIKEEDILSFIHENKNSVDNISWISEGKILGYTIEDRNIPIFGTLPKFSLDKEYNKLDEKAIKQFYNYASSLNENLITLDRENNPVMYKFKPTMSISTQLPIPPIGGFKAEHYYNPNIAKKDY